MGADRGAADSGACGECGVSAVDIGVMRDPYWIWASLPRGLLGEWVFQTADGSGASVKRSPPGGER
jgi:hypothetical protein